MAGMFITFEGGEGVGKSTQARLLADHLRAQGHDVVLTREPGGAPGAEQIRDLLVRGDPARWEPMSEALLHIAARVDHVAKTIQPALDRGAWVISDRFRDSTLVYQGLAQGVGRERIESLHALALGSPDHPDGLLPDLTFILDLPPAEGLLRAHSRQSQIDDQQTTKASNLAEDRYERMGDAFHHALSAAFQKLAIFYPERCHLIDASGDEHQVAQIILKQIASLKTRPVMDAGQG
ncbi:thymidylate kinase [Iodidimonas nitroreducens]|uniref:Thymidylate kinase n=2 Tax=Iodidimonas nitroreducens TaxID=1236968 RepID=A0A5A7N3Y1_9PROT|nr:thymidylate kinase [Iodidimonas nitroreducens]